MTAEGNNEMFQSYSDYIMERDNFYSQNSVSDIIAAHLKMMMMSFEKYYPEHEDLRRQNMWIMNPFVEYKETALSHGEKNPFNLLSYHRTKDWKVLLILCVIRNFG